MDDGPAAGAYSQAAAQVMAAQQTLHPDCDPNGRTTECACKTPIIVCVDVTGSMGDWTKVIWDKMPMFYGQIMMQAYLDDPAIMFAAVGDACDGPAPLQVTPFGYGGEIDTNLKKLWTFQAGGGNEKESYDLAAFYFNKKVNFTHPSPAKPFLFITGDEGLYSTINPDWVREKLGMDIEGSPSVHTIFRELRAKYHVFFICKQYSISSKRGAIRRQWESLVGAESILDLEDPRAVVDVMLGAIAVRSGARTVDSYMADMVQRGQTAERQTTVSRILAGMPAAYGGVDGGVDIPEISEERALELELAAAKAELEMMREQEAENAPKVLTAAEQRELEALRAAPVGWSCAVCTVVNPTGSRSCQVCGTANPSAPQVYRSS